MSTQAEKIQAVVKDYELKFYAYNHASERAAEYIRLKLIDENIHARVTHRAKDARSLYKKLEKRLKERKMSDPRRVLPEIKDLAGVRIELYFPGDWERVQQFIKEDFKFKEHRSHPDGQKPQKGPSGHLRRGQGYCAHHYWVSLQPSQLEQQSEIILSDVIIEIQVASILMHAWSEVEHDIIYKMVDGIPSVEEEAVLDEINNLVIAGEIALDQLRRLRERRLKDQKTDLQTEFRSTFMDLKESLSQFKGTSSSTPFELLIRSGLPLGLDSQKLRRLGYLRMAVLSGVAVSSVMSMAINDMKGYSKIIKRETRIRARNQAKPK